MAANKYLELTTAGTIAEKAATVQSAGVGDDGKLVALDATGKLDTTVLPTGVGAETALIVCSEDLAAGDLVNIYDATGTATCRKADAATNKPAHGFVIAGVTNGQNATIYFEGTNTQLTGLTVGTRYFLSDTTPGAVTATAPTTANYLVQYVGTAHSATAMSIELANPIVRA